MNLFPQDVQNKLGEHVGNVGRLRQTESAFRTVSGDRIFTMLGEQEDNTSECFSRPYTALVKVQLLNASINRFLYLSLSSNCSATYATMYVLLKHVCDKVLVLRLHRLGPSLMTPEQVDQLFLQILTASNSIRVLEIQASDDLIVADTVRRYPTFEKVERLRVLLPDVFVGLSPNQTAFSPEWFPNVIQRRIFEVITSLEPSRYARLRDVEILKRNGAPLETVGMGAFRFGFRRDEHGRIVDYE